MDDRLAMNKSTKTLILLLTISGSALADDAGIQRCRGIVNATVRLACYDSLVVPMAAASAATGKPVAAAEARPSPPTPAAATAPATSPAAPPPQTSAIAPIPAKSDTFGLEHRASVVAVEAIESYIPGRFEGWEPKSNITLANGQVWQVTDDTSRYLLLNDAKVRVRRGALGAFYLEFEKSNHSPRVRRVK